MKHSNNYVAIMAGGIGSRFWPMSRQNYPKQFLDILGTGKTLIQQTVDRFAKFIPLENIFIVTSEEYNPIVLEQLPQIKPENILCEPSRKNTAPCVAYISYKLQQFNPEGSLICAPADHLILDETEFERVCVEALDFTSKNDALLTLGIKPSYPNTGYGYIQYDQQIITDHVFKVKTFTEKPNFELAQTFLASGDFLWNAGIFVWQIKNIITAFRTYLPEMAEVFDAEIESFNTSNEPDAIGRIYPQCTNISIDYGIMEKANNVYIIPSSFGWSDLGTWNSAYENMEKDENANAIKGNNIITVDTSNCMIQGKEEKLYLLQGLENYILIDTKDALLVCNKNKEQEIKEYVADIKRKKGERFL